MTLLSIVNTLSASSRRPPSNSTTTQSTMSVSSPLRLLITLSILTFTMNVVSSSSYLGCYKDKWSFADRDLTGALFLEEKLTSIAYCEAKCGSYNFAFFGLQYGQECWCGSKYGKYDKVDDSQCNKPCAANDNEMCGGDLVNSVYSVDSSKLDTSRPPGVHAPFATPNNRPLLGLVMIVKNEAHTLPNTLQSLKPYLDYYHILDTGSTDGTQEIIKKALAPVRGEVIEEPFIDYGRSRNRALELAQIAPIENRPIFSLMLSADETVYNAESLRRHCEQRVLDSGDDSQAYPIQMDVGWKFDSVRLSRTDNGWRYVGRVHEYLASPDRKWHKSVRVPDSYIKFKVTDPERRSNREYTILKILLEEKAEKPTDTRTSFYLARTYNVIGNHSEALTEFQRRISLGGWQEEVYESYYAIAWQLESLGKPWFEIENAFLDAYNHSPERAEPLYSIAQHYYKASKYQLAYMYAYHGATITYPTKAVLWVQQAVYAWQCKFLVGMTASHFDTKDKDLIGTRALLLVQHVKPDDSAIVKQLEVYRKRLTTNEWAQVEASVALEPKLIMPTITDMMSVNSGSLPSSLAGGAAPLLDHQTEQLSATPKLSSNVLATLMNKTSDSYSWTSLILVLIVLTAFICIAVYAARQYIHSQRFKKSSYLPFGANSNDKVV